MIDNPLLQLNIIATDDRSARQPIQYERHKFVPQVDALCITYVTFTYRVAKEKKYLRSAICHV